MYNIQIDSSRYWTGGALEQGCGTYGNDVFVNSIPAELDIRRRQAYKLVDGTLILDSERLAEIETEIASRTDPPTMDERTSALEAAVLEIALGGTVNG